MRRPPVGRLVALLTVLLLGLVGIVVRLAVLQVRDASAYQTLAREQRVEHIPLPAGRGSILDRDGQPLALSLHAADVYADPALIVDPAATAARLAPLLDTRERELRGLIEETDTNFVYLARQVDLRIADRVERLRLPGIGLLDASKRYYPNGTLASHVLGIVDVDGKGLEGLELHYDDRLAGTPGERVVEIDPGGHLIPQGVNRDTPPIRGDDVVTTIDKELQYRVQEALREAVVANRAKSGQVIVMERGSGEILAMASYPWFDPNDVDHARETDIRNRVVTDVYEPGSVNKVITASAAVQEHAIPLDSTLQVPDAWQVADHLFHDAHPHPPERMTLADIIAQSSNIGTIRIAEMLGPDALASYLQRFGLGRPTGVGFPGEVDGIVPPVDQWSGTSMGTIPVGQGIAVTPLQMATVYATIANGGVWVQPRLVRGSVGAHGRFAPAPPARRHRVVSARTARIVSRMLAFAVEAGTGKLAQIGGYWVAGKTGTAKIALPDRPGYYSDRYVASFIGFLPASDPRVIIAAILDEPVTEYGGVAAAPLFQKVARYAISQLRIQPAPRPELPPHVIGPEDG